MESGHAGADGSASELDLRHGAGRRFLADVEPLTDGHEALDLGDRLRELRVAQGLTQQEVADRAELSRAFLSEVERNQVSPSVASVSRIARALNLSLSGLFARPENSEGLVRGSKRLVVGYRGYQDELVSPSLSGRLLVLVSKFEPGATSGDELYAHDADEECILVLEGTLDIRLEQKAHRLEAGDALTFGSRRGHGWANPSRSRASALWVMTPPRY